jgi:predicted Rossmann fold flavoprotein
LKYKEELIYDLIIVGAGAAGLFAGASLPAPMKGLILEKGKAPGRKLLMSGAGQCNLTHEGNIKDFITHYGENGSRIRSLLYRFNNQAVINFFEMKGVPLFQRADGKVFPKFLQAKEVLNALLDSCYENGLEIVYSSQVVNIIKQDSSSTYTVQTKDQSYKTKKIIITTGGASYPTTGSDGGFYEVIKDLGIQVNPLKPSLVPLFVQDYPYKELSGISFQNSEVTILPMDKFNEKENRNSITISEKLKTKKIINKDALLLTHTGFSGPAILNLSRYISIGQQISINYYNHKPFHILKKELSAYLKGNSKQLITALYEYFNQDLSQASSRLPKRFLEIICLRSDMDPTQKASQLSGKALHSVVSLITQDTYSVSGLGGFNVAMVTKGGVDLDEINIKTMECKKYPGLFFAGEVLDVDGDTGGYNLQFAFSSGYTAANGSRIISSKNHEKNSSIEKNSKHN